MSSFVSHALVGGSCLVMAFPQVRRQRRLPAVLIGAALGLCPDIDYLLLWSLGWEPEPRITHSFAFVITCSTAAWFLIRHLFPKQAFPRLLLALFAAAASHLVMDACVGVTSNPLAWPLSSEGYRITIGLLPSAGKLELRNYFFWRNLFIELGIVLPALCLAYCVTFGRSLRVLSLTFGVCLCVFVIALAISLALSR